MQMAAGLCGRRAPQRCAYPIGRVKNTVCVQAAVRNDMSGRRVPAARMQTRDAAWARADACYRAYACPCRLRADAPSRASYAPCVRARRQPYARAVMQRRKCSLYLHADAQPQGDCAKAIRRSVARVRVRTTSRSHRRLRAVYERGR